ncbi:MAG: bifunctional UDP-N-acetylglucosamine diphosphorylase/glucosamine-1-phosphate N-acetyltransferase GlmU [Anaerorhabdus sp.]
MKSAIILAAGKGTRMNSDIPKCMHKVCDKSMIDHLIDTAKEANATRVIAVLGHESDVIKDHIDGRCDVAIQMPQLGTGHALMQVKQLYDVSGVCTVLNGDAPCIKKETIEKIYTSLEDADMVIVSGVMESPRAYGRILRDVNGNVEKIVEFKDCSESEKKIKEVNLGLYGFKNELLFKHLKDLKNNNQQNEYYITDLVEIFNKNNLKIKVVEVSDLDEVLGINDQVELAYANKVMKRMINEKLMSDGVVIIDPDNTYISKDSTVLKGAIIHPGSTILKNSVIGENSIIYPNCYLENADIGKNCIIKSSYICSSKVSDNCQIGPYAHLREHTLVEKDVRIGNFVEFKKTKFGKNSKCAHLTYLGDSVVGEDVNIGCGVVTANYDGKVKHQTIIGDKSFIGCNTNLIAPVKVGNNSIIAAGSTITKNVGDNDFAIARSHQEIKAGYAEYIKNKRGKNQ